MSDIFIKIKRYEKKPVVRRVSEKRKDEVLKALKDGCYEHSIISENDYICFINEDLKARAKVY